MDLETVLILLTTAKMMKVTRVEVIDETGRSYTKSNTQGYLTFQDGGKTLKVFLSPRD
jgi:hypothetical protein